MFKRPYILIILCAVVLSSCSEKEKSVEGKSSVTSYSEKSIYYDSEVENKISELLAKMTLEEKVGQMTQVTLDFISKGAYYDTNKKQELDDSLLNKAIVKYKVGSILNTGQYTMPRQQWQNIIGKIQSSANKTRLKIPVLYGVDAIHGVNYTVGGTLFPQELATAATFNTAHAYNCGEVTAYELRASSIPWNFSPVLDLGRQPLWSRFFETFGEDPYLVTQMGNAIVEGYQGEVSDKKIDQFHAAACLKHFVGYSNSKTGKDRTPIQMSERELREYYLPPFEKAIEKGAQTVMINSTEINGTPMHANYHVLTEVLKEEIGFDGLAVTDWEDIIFLHTTHKIARDEKQATKIAINAGVDMSMTPLSLKFADYLVELVNEGEVPMSRIDDAVSRILRVKYRLNLFDYPTTLTDDYPDFGSEKFSTLALNAARESITLLKNKEHVLPLSKDVKVLFAGLGANSLNALNGAWTHTWQGQNSDFNTEGKATVFEAAQKIIEDKASFVEGVNFEALTNVDEAKQAARKSDVIVICLSELPATEKVGDIKDLNLPLEQKNLVKALAGTNKPLIAVLLQSRPRIISDIEPLFDAVIEAYWPGDEGGVAIAETLFGDNNPSGKLPFTYPRHVNDLLTYDHKFSEKKDKSFGLNAFDPQWEFGEGLSYTTFEYSDLTLSDTILSDNIIVSVNISNVGDVKGKESVLLFTRDHFASITPSVKRLRKFVKVELTPGESETVKFKIEKEDLAFMDKNLDWITEKGRFDVLIGSLKRKFKVIE